MFAALVPPAVVTLTLAVPDPEGVMQVAVVALVTAKLLHRLPPIWILVAPVRSVPVIVILVPPKLMPEVGDTEVTVGGEGGGGGVT